MTRRNTELMLLCIAAPLVILLFAMVALNEGNRVTLDNLTVPLSMFATFVVAHLAIRKLAPGADPAILPLSFALSGIGIAFITRLAPDLAMKQVGWLFLGVVFMVLAARNHLCLHTQSGTVVVVIPLTDSPDDCEKKHPNHQQKYRSKEKGKECVKKSKHGKSHLSASFFIIVTDFSQKLNREIGRKNFYFARFPGCTFLNIQKKRDSK